MSKPADRISNTNTYQKIGVFTKCRKKVLTVVLGPPTKVVAMDEMVKDVANQHPGYIVERCRGRQVGCACKDDWKIKILKHTQSDLFV